MNNRIIFTDIQLVKGFVRNLLYPAILGSLIYDITRFEYTLEYFLKCITIVFYVADYFYMYYVITNDKNGESEKPLAIFLDFIVAIFFMGIIYSIYKSHYICILILTALIFISALNYFKNTKWSSPLILGLIAISLLTLIFQIIIFRCCSCDYEQTIVWTYPLLVLFYLLVMLIDYYIDTTTKS